MTISRPGRLALTTLSLGCLAAAPALSQDGPGLVGTLSFETGLEASDNPDLLTSPDGTVISSVTDLGFSLGSETRTQQLRFNVSTSLDAEIGSNTTSVDALQPRNSSIGLSYAKQGTDSELSFSANYSKFDIKDEAFGFFVDGEFDPDALVIDGGSRERTDLRAGFRTGIDRPLGFSLSARSSAISYTGVSDPDLVDSDSTSVDGSMRLQLNPALTGRVLAGTSRTDKEDAVDTSTRRSYVGVGLDTELSDGVSINGDLTFDRAKTITTGGTDTEDGIGFKVGTTFDRPDGELGFDVASRVDESGRRTSASARRSFDLPDGGLSLSLGVVDQTGEDLEFTTSVSYLRETPLGEFRANLTQSPTTRSGDAFLNTAIRLNYTRALDDVSSFDAGFSYGAARAFGDTGGDTRTSASIAYTRGLTEDWDMRAGLQHITIGEDGSPDRSSNTIFLTVGRDFTFGF